MKKLSLFLALIALIGFSSCSTLRIEKRQYSGGWYVDFGKDAKTQSNSCLPTSVGNAVDGAPGADGYPLPETVVAIEDNVADNQTTEQSQAGVASVQSAGDDKQSAKDDVVVLQPQINPAVSNAENSANSSSAPAAEPPLWVMVLLCLFIPPLAVYFKRGISNIFWIDLIFAILGFGFRWSPFIGGAFLVAVVIAFLVVFDAI